MTTTRRNVAEWDALEASKLAELEQLKAKLKKADEQRADVILQLGDTPDDKNAKKQLETIELERKRLTLEIESITSLLGAIPERRKHARADEIEEEIKHLQNLKAQLIFEAPKIDAAAEAFVMAGEPFHRILREIIARNSWAFAGHYPEISYMSIPFFLEKHGMLPADKHSSRALLSESIDKHPTVDNLHRLIENMRESVKQLRGEEIRNNLGFCSYCFGVGKYADSTSDRVICAKCGRQISE